MGGVGKWIKKHPLETVGILGAAFTGGTSLGLFGPAAAGGAVAGDLALASALGGAAEGGGGALAGFSGLGGANAIAPMALLESAAPQYAALNAGAFTPTAPNALTAGLDAMPPYAKFAGQAQGLLSPEQQQMPAAQPQGYRGPGQQNAVMSPYDDPELKKRMAMMAQSGRFYG
jgi:hypothetical protein